MGQTHCLGNPYYHDYRFGPPIWGQPYYHHGGGPHFANDYQFRPNFGFGGHHGGGFEGGHHGGGFGGGHHGGGFGGGHHH